VSDERAEYRARIDSLLDELSRLRALNNAFTVFGGTASPLLDEVQKFSDECMEENARLKKKVAVMMQFANAAEQTNYRPYAWEIKLILQDHPVKP
jgi:hypothetical protein